VASHSYENIGKRKIIIPQRKLFLLRLVIFGLMRGPSSFNRIKMILTAEPICGAAIPLPNARRERKSSSVSRRFWIIARVDFEEEFLIGVHFERRTGFPSNSIFLTAIEF
jgi:hypothetical protein